MTVFIFGLLFRRTPLQAAMVARLLGIPVYGLFLWLLPDGAFLNHMTLTFAILFTVMAAITFVKPFPKPVKFEARSQIALAVSPVARALGGVVIVVTAALYFIFW
ncbi:MAG: hypothetical protein ACE5HX_12500 [bacterium]